MAPIDGEFQAPGEPGRKTYVAPKIIFSELYARGVGVKSVPAPAGTPDYHTTTTNSTS